jgi:N-acetylglucosaminyltransferase
VSVALLGFSPHPFGWLPLSAIGIVVWGGWLGRQLLGALYRPAVNGHTMRSSLIVPVYREDPEVLLRCLRSWQRNDPDEILLVIDVSEREVIELARQWEQDDPRVRYVVAVKPGKRHALCLGVRAARYEAAILTDSDTVWAEDFLRTVLMGFADPGVGGVGCRQSVLAAESSLWRHVADWMLDVRYLHFLPAMGRRQAIPCISGRTAAYRRSAILPLLDELEFETFFGRPCISGDDGRLTWLILRDGWKAAYQGNARVWTVFPNTFRGFVKQRIRWSRNSYRCYLRAMATGWLWKQPAITSISVLQNLCGPFTLSLATFYLVVELAGHRWGLAALALSWLMAGRAIKGIGHILREPRGLVYLPLITAIFIVVMIPVKFYALVTMNRQGWITRTAENAVADGQAAVTLA